jgi:DNA-binding transcriptional LysR family regulator
MQLKDMEVFMTAARTQNLRAAADLLGVTQPAVSKAIRRLETSLGARLFERTARGVALTRIGEVLVERGQSLQGLVAQIRTEIGDISAGQSALVRLGSVPLSFEAVVVPLLAQMTRGDAPVRFDLHLQLSSELLRQLQAGTLDLAIAAMPAERPPELNSLVLGSVISHVVVARSHPILRKPFTLADLAAQQWVLAPPDVALHQWVAGVFREAGHPLPAPIVQSDSSPQTFRSLVRQTRLLTVMTEALPRAEIGEGLVPLGPPAPRRQVQLALFWRRNAFFSSAMLRCRAEIRRLFHAAAEARQRSHP